MTAHDYNPGGAHFPALRVEGNLRQDLMTRSFKKRKRKRKSAVLMFFIAIAMMGVLLIFANNQSIGALLNQDHGIPASKQEALTSSIQEKTLVSVDNFGSGPIEGASGNTLPNAFLDIPFIYQREEYPTGCESVSTVMALNNLGIDISVSDFIDNYLDIGQAPHIDESGVWSGCSPWKAFPGDPYSNSGYGCFAPVITNALSKFLDPEKHEVLELYNWPIDELCCRYINNGIPVVLWASINMRPASQSSYWYDEETGEKVDWVTPMHCSLLVGYDDDCYYFNDPWKDKGFAYLKSDVEQAYEAMYSQAVVIKPR
ncbi:MAG: C39 family peptidase [Eubacteriaceae bacterium]|nr:C39 family peptidase [Eubacteriaceae bacterium]